MKKITLLFRKSQTLVAQEDQISNLNASVGKIFYPPCIRLCVWSLDTYQKSLQLPKRQTEDSPI